MKTYLILFFGWALAYGQETLQLEEGQVSPPANLEEVAWISGHWKGEAMGGIAEELWSPPLGGSMMFVFRLINDGKVTFYESGHIKQAGETLLMQLKHFDGELKGWEEKADTVDFRLVKLTKNKAYFVGLTFEKVGADRLHIYVLLDDGKNREEVLFQFQRMDQFANKTIKADHQEF